MSSDETRYIWINDWDEHQSMQKKRGVPWTPPWIKNHTRLLHSDAYLGLSGNRRAILHGLWLEFASSRCRVAVDPVSISRRLSLRVTVADLESLNDAGWITFCSGTVLERFRERFWNGSNLEVEGEKNIRAVTPTRDVARARANGTALEDLDHDLLRDIPY